MSAFLFGYLLHLLLLLNKFYLINSDTGDNSKPNILFILLDDLGYGDISATTGQFPTPNIDSLYSNSIHFNRHYVHLMCSPSRTQFLTGRYAMNLGFGSFFPWDYTEIGGIPLGQPTIANWLKEYGNYNTYAIGKWHVGYATKELTPLYKGFDHFYGFYQGAIDYETKHYIDIVTGDENIFDFWDDNMPEYAMIDDNTNTMYLYSKKIIKYIEDYVESDDRNINPFFMYAALQSMHDPIPTVPEYEDICNQIISEHSLYDDYISERLSYCQLLLLTDYVIGLIIDALHQYDLYDNTLIIFSTDNGGSIQHGSSNYPLRGTKGESYDGNIRTLAFVGGGIIDKELYGTEFNGLFSNLDWTPTLLEFTGYLDKISVNDYTWDGVSQYKSIMDPTDTSNQREVLVLNIGDTQFDSVSILFQEDNVLYKYIHIGTGDDSIDQWIYSGDYGDGWSIVNELDHSSSVIYYDENVINEDLMYSQEINNAFLFDLTNDESEKINLLRFVDDNDENSDNIQRIIHKSYELLIKFTEDNNEFIPLPIQFLHDRMEEKGNPLHIDDGLFVRPFLTKQQYLELIEKLLKQDEINKGVENTDKLWDIYLNDWESPIAINTINIEIEMQELNNNIQLITNNNNSLFYNAVILIIAMVLFVMFIKISCYADDKYTEIN